MALGASITTCAIVEFCVVLDKPKQSTHSTTHPDTNAHTSGHAATQPDLTRHSTPREYYGIILQQAAARCLLALGALNTYTNTTSALCSKTSEWANQYLLGAIELDSSIPGGLCCALALCLRVDGGHTNARTHSGCIDARTLASPEPMVAALDSCSRDRRRLMYCSHRYWKTVDDEVRGGVQIKGEAGPHLRQCCSSP